MRKLGISLIVGSNVGMIIGVLIGVVMDNIGAGIGIGVGIGTGIGITIWAIWSAAKSSGDDLEEGNQSDASPTDLAK